MEDDEVKDGVLLRDLPGWFRCAVSDVETGQSQSAPVSAGTQAQLATARFDTMDLFLPWRQYGVDMLAKVVKD